jgi:ABC-2 type transport system ATP-binding protein
MNAVEVSALTKTYGRFEALRGVDLAVPTGTVFGLVGPNGAGKSTLIKALVGALRPSGGRVRVLDLDPLANPVALRRQLGYMPQAPALYDDLSARDNIAFFGRAHGMDDPRRRVDAVLELTELAARAGDRIHTFSGGMQRRVSLACALVHDPRILFLDEPTAAVDPALRARFWRTFRELAARGVTLFISTHLMDEALLCDRVAILRRGRVVACDTPQAILARGHTRLRVWRDGTSTETTIGSRPADLASALHCYGLAPDVSAVELARDSLDEVVLSLIQGEGEA